MLLNKGASKVILRDGVGLVMGLYLELNDYQVSLAHIGMDEMLAMREGDVPNGVPCYFALTQETPSKTVIMFYPNAAKRYELTFDYYPHAKRV